jgi:hypothetical protein
MKKFLFLGLLVLGVLGGCANQNELIKKVNEFQVLYKNAEVKQGDFIYQIGRAHV